ncbi:MAG: helix-turn-helix transcriptional regulator, partial [Actinomadura rubrobrunea]|nr:helix-turn-helix transcriptional regulator [Actinomadura rubrobrunea]
SGLSKSYLSRVERGLRALDRRSHIAALANALRVSETELVGGPHLTKDPVQAGPHAAIPALRVAIQTNRLGDALVDRARPLPELVAEVRALEETFIACDYLGLGERLPGVIDELHLHVCAPTDEAAQRAALEALVESYMYATFRTRDLGYHDLAHQAAWQAERAAQMLADPIVIGKSDYLRVQSMPRENSWNRALVAAERAAERLQPHATHRRGLEVLGMLTLSASMAAAAQHKVDTARHWLDEARDLASRVPDTPVENWSSFSATNTQVWAVAIAVECNESAGTVLDLARRVDAERISGRRSRHASFLADVGRGLARERQYREAAVQWLSRAEKVAPQRIRNSRPVQESISVLLAQAQREAVGRELRGMAARMGIPH